MSAAAPSSAAYVVAGAIVGLTLGYFWGQASGAGVVGGRPAKAPPKKSWPNSYDVTIHPDSSDEELMQHLRSGTGAEEAEDSEDSEQEAGGELAPFAGNADECKLVLVVRTDLGMGKGTENGLGATE